MELLGPSVSLFFAPYLLWIYKELQVCVFVCLAEGRSELHRDVIQTADRVQHLLCCKWKNYVESMYVALEQWFMDYYKQLAKQTYIYAFTSTIQNFGKRVTHKVTPMEKTRRGLASCPRRV